MIHTCKKSKYKNNLKTKKQKIMAEKRYTNGIFIKSVQTKYGSLLNVSISKTALEEL